MAKKFNISSLISSLVISICFPCLADIPSTQQSTSKQLPTTQTAPTSPALYVSPSGNDSNAGTSPATPFATLKRAQKAMRNSSIKTTYLLGGTYTLRSPLTLSLDDQGESWLAYPGQTPILNGNGTTNRAIQLYDTNNVTINGLIITNFSGSGIASIKSTNMKITNNIITNINSNDWNQAAILALHTFSNSTISHNYINTTQYGGIVIATATGDDISNVTIDSNVVYNTCLSVDDCGAIYANDRNHASTNIRITHNLIENYGANIQAGVGIYLDDFLSNALVSNNTVAGKGTYAVEIHGGDHNVIKNNIFEISQASYLVAYSAIDGGMDNNVFSCNIVLSSDSNSNLWLDYSNGKSLPAVSSNAYSTLLRSKATAGKFADTKPTFTDVTLTRATQKKLNFSPECGE